MSRPYDFSEAREAISKASLNQKNAEAEIRRAYREFGEKERAYRKALAQRILELRGDKIPVTVIQDMAKGDLKIADLRFERDLAEGVREAAVSAIWRHSADRRELEQLVSWSMRVAPDGQYQAGDVR